MVIGIIGENCSGKTTLANSVQAQLGGRVYSGRDYMRFGKSEATAVELFKKELANALNGENIIYVITEKEHVALLPDGAVKILVSADIDTIKERFKARMHGVLPQPVALMLEKKHGSFDDGEYDIRYDGVSGDPDQVCRSLIALGGES